MLVLSRRPGETIVLYIGETRVAITVDARTRVMIDAPPRVRVLRAELEGKDEGPRRI